VGTQKFLMRPEFVIPAKAGIHGTPRNLPAWMPAFAGMTLLVCQWMALLGKAVSPEDAR
jgi:hypothetical protein